MSDIWTGWSGWRLTTDHSTSSYGQPVLVSPTGRAYKPGDIEPDKYTQSDLAKALGVSRAAITGRINRGTLPEYDSHDANGRGYWRYETIKPLLPNQN